MTLTIHGSTHLIPAHYSFIDPEKNETLSWPGRLTCSGWFTHNSCHPSAASRAWGQGKFAGQRPTFYMYTTVLRNTVKNISIKIYSPSGKFAERAKWSPGPHARASSFRRFTNTNVYRTGSVKMWKTLHKISMDIRIYNIFYSVVGLC